MSFLTLNQAAKVAKKAKSTLLEAIRKGRLYAYQNDKNQWQIDSEDLFRLYPQTGQKPDVKTEVDPSLPNDETALLRQQVEFLKQQLNDIKDERDDLRRRLNEEADERRKLTAWITKVLDEQVLCPGFTARKEENEEEESYSDNQPVQEDLHRSDLHSTQYQYTIYTALVRGKDLIIGVYLNELPDGLLLSYRMEELKYLCEIGVLLSFSKFNEIFMQVAMSILQDRAFEKITNDDLREIAKRHNEWSSISSGLIHPCPNRFS